MRYGMVSAEPLERLQRHPWAAHNVAGRVLAARIGLLKMISN